jgi:acyl carrier protein
VHCIAVIDKIAPTLPIGTVMTQEAIANKIKQLLIETLSLSTTVEQLGEDTPLLGHIPEFDSMAIVSVITSLEETFDIQIEDDELDAEVFESIGTLIQFVHGKH